MKSWNKAFLICSWRFLRSSELEQLEVNVEEFIGIQKLAGKVRYGILLPKLFCPTERKNYSSDREKLWKFEAEGREFAKKIYSNSDMSEQLLVTECFF